MTIKASPPTILLCLGSNVGGGAGTLKLALGFKVGYIFEGFWAVKEKKAD